MYTPTINLKRINDCHHFQARMTQEDEIAAEQSEEKGAVTSIEFKVPQRDFPVLHPPVDAPLCKNCKEMDLVFLDPDCPGCKENLFHPNTTIAQILAIVRQWMPQTQQNIEILINEILKRGAHINDRDGLTDMTLLHFACKSGSSGVGDPEVAAKVVSSLLMKGADMNLRCRWTHMTSLHYAAYFGVAPVLRLLLQSSKGANVNITCPEFENGTALHIAASNLCLEAAAALLEFNANPTARDDLGRTPAECVPDASSFQLVPDVQNVIEQMLQLLRNAEAGVMAKDSGLETISGRALLKSMGLKLGDKVTVGTAKSGILRFCGTTEFATGIWAGIELDTPDGKNDGSVNGVMYFKCLPSHGIFAPINKINKLGSPMLTRKPSVRGSSRSVNFPKVDLSHVTSKIETGLSVTKQRQKSPELVNLELGERVLVAGHRRGTIRFSGETQFSTGWWYGIELDTPSGKNDGSVQDVRYFTCKINHGVFAPPSRVTKLTSSSDEYLSDVGSSLEAASCVTYTVSDSVRTTPDPEPKKPSPLTRSQSLRSNFRRQPNAGLRSSLRRPADRKGDTWLTEGMNVLINNELGTVKYIGPVEFAEGNWIGVELRNAKGRNDGSIQGKRYFICKPNHGLLVRPHKVTVRGINGAKLLPET